MPNNSDDGSEYVESSVEMSRECNTERLIDRIKDKIQKTRLE
jgi:hypothetical protein